MRNIKLTLEYDGTKFFGFQVQKNRRTVQSELELALRKLFQSARGGAALGREKTKKNKSHCIRPDRFRRSCRGASCPFQNQK